MKWRHRKCFHYRLKRGVARGGAMAVNGVAYNIINAVCRHQAKYQMHPTCRKIAASGKSRLASAMASMAEAILMASKKQQLDGENEGLVAYGARVSSV